MHVLLVKPYNLSDHIQPSLGLGYLANAIRDKCKVRILDCIKDNINIKRFSKIVDANRPDLVGLQCYTFDLKFIRDALITVKNIDKNIKTVIGGPHPSALPFETMDYFGNNLDFAFKGECEKGLPRLLDFLEDDRRGLSDIPGLVWREGNKIKANECLFEENIDSLGMPAWDLIRPETYPESQHGAFYKNFPIAPIILTRGCPYRCTFCAGKVVSGTRLRKRSIRNVITEIKILYQQHGIREFHIVDDNFTLDRDYAKGFLNKLIEENLNISLATPNGIRMETLDSEMLFLMKKAGLYLISLGIESGSNRVLALMKKNLTVERIKEIVNFISYHGFDIAGFFILGFPGENKEEILATINLSLNLKLIRANYFTFLPFPGTESYKVLEENGELNAVNWDRFYFMNAAYTPRAISRSGLKRLQRSAFLKFYLRPRILWKNLSSIRSFRHFRYLLKRFFHWIIIY